MRRISCVFIFIVSFSLMAYAGFIFSAYSATPANNKVTISWVTTTELEVARFIILRSSDDNTFSEVGSKLAKGTAGNYSYTDENVIFKGPQTFFYKIRAVRNDNSLVEETASLLVNQNISGMLRTWGAIKAMFR